MSLNDEWLPILVTAFVYVKFLRWLDGLESKKMWTWFHRMFCYALHTFQNDKSFICLEVMDNLDDLVPSIFSMIKHNDISSQYFVLTIFNLYIY